MSLRHDALASTARALATGSDRGFGRSGRNTSDGTIVRDESGEAMKPWVAGARVAGVLIAAIATLLTTACGGQSDRSAGPESEAPLESTESVAPSSEPTDGPAGSSGNLGTRVCVINESTRYRLFVTFSKKDSETGAGTVAYGEQGCAEGTFGSGGDVVGRISPDKELQTVTFGAGNPWIGKPYNSLAYNSNNIGYRCTSKDGFDVNEERIWDDGVMRYLVKRLPDGTWKEFQIIVSDSQDPTGDGLQRDCPREGGFIGPV